MIECWQCPDNPAMVLGWSEIVCNHFIDFGRKSNHCLPLLAIANDYGLFQYGQCHPRTMLKQPKNCSWIGRTGHGWVWSSPDNPRTIFEFHEIWNIPQTCPISMNSSECPTFCSLLFYAELRALLLALEHVTKSQNVDFLHHLLILTVCIAGTAGCDFRDSLLMLLLKECKESVDDC